jgi:3-methyladenine DNA glycosylase/8-oxoguanine DNA glycosylase
MEAVFTPRGPYRLRLMARSGCWTAPLPGGRRVVAWQVADGRVHVRSSDEEGLERARFMLALDDDTSEFHRRFARDPLLGPSARALTGYRPLRRGTVTHAVLRGFCGQLIESRRAAAIERAVLRRCGEEVATRDRLAALAPVELRRLGLASHRAAALVRVCRTIDVEGLRAHATPDVLARLRREPGIGPWTCGVIALEGLGRFDHGLVGDLGLVKLASSLRGRWVEAAETAELLAPYGAWQGLAGEILMLGWGRGLVPGADADFARHVRVRARRAA